jgi:hypothetical protein
MGVDRIDECAVSRFAVSIMRSDMSAFPATYRLCGGMALIAAAKRA